MQINFKAQAFTNKYRAAFQKNPLLKNFLIAGEESINATAAGSTERLKAIMEIFDKAMPVEVINAMRGSVSGMQEGLRSAFFDQQSGLFGLSRPIQKMGKDGPIVKQGRLTTSEMHWWTVTETFSSENGKEYEKGSRITVGRNEES